MTRHAIATGYEITVLVSTVAALLLGLRALVARTREGTDFAGSSRAAARSAIWAHPLAQLALVCALLLVNQLVFNAYVLRVHGGNAWFLQRYLGPGWCVLEQGSLVRALASASGGGRWMAPSVLRVQAFLELPFTLFAYLAVARGLSGRVYQSLTRLPILFLASLSFTSAFCLAEIRLANPWTTDDLVLRGIACGVVPFWVAWTARHHSAPSNERRPSALGLLVFLVGAGAIAILVLGAYDILLLYNLGHLRQYAFVLLMAAFVALLASRAPRGPVVTSPSLTACHSALSAFTFLFFVPSLAIRYWSFHALAQVCGLLLVAVSLVAGVVAGMRSTSPLPRGLRLLAWAAGFASGAFGAALVGSTTSARIGEITLALGALAFLVPTILVSRGVEMLLAGYSRAPDAPPMPRSGSPSARSARSALARAWLR